MTTPATTHPKASVEDARRLAREIFGLECAEISELPSERDQNFLLKTAAGPRVLKIDGPTESDAVLDLQNAALAWIAERSPELPVPRVLARSKDGRTRLLSWLPGTLLAEARPRSTALLSRAGNLLGRLDSALAGFRHPAAVGRDLLWDPARASEVIERHRDEIEEPERRALVAEVHALYTREVVPLLPRLPRSVIHNDGNDYNVLVGPPAPSAGDREVTGILDFGDMVETWTVCELAVAVAYGIFGHAQPLPAAESLVAGYHAARPLTEAEADVLWILSAMRLCTSVSLSAHRRRAASGNAYHFVSENSAWEALRRMAGVHPRFARAALRAAAGFTPCPHTPAIEAWLRAHRDELAPLVDADISRAVVFDLSVGSPEFRTPAETLDTAAMTPRLFAHMREAGTEVGIGRYDEARLVYGGDAFAAGLGEHPERRTIHIALDVFMQPGSPVHAPLAGRVHAVHDNAARFDYGPTLILEHAPEGAPRFYTLYGHLAPDVLGTLSPGDAVARGQRVAAIGAPPGNGDWPPHVHFQIVTDMLDGDGEFHGVGAASERAVWLGLSPDPGLALVGARPDFRAPAESPARLEDERRRRLGRNLSLSYRRPLEIVRGAGTWLFDERGRAFLDMVNNVAHVGHAHPRVVAAGARQMTVLNTNTRYLHPSILRYAERLAAALPEPLSVCFFVCSGSEANELALRMARARTGRRGVVVLGGAYHGNTQGLVEVSPYKFDGPGGAGRPGHVRVVPMPDDYRGLHRRDDPDRAEKYAAYVAEAVRDGAVGAFLAESLLSCGGQIVLPPGYLLAAYRHARAAGAVCIADEVQVGFGRVGSRFWGFETQEVVPDIVTLGKPIGNGHPLGAVVTTPEIAASFANGMEYFNTFGGNPVSCEIGLAVLDVIRDEGLPARALAVGEFLLAGLERLVERHEAAGDARGLGLFLGLELVESKASRVPSADRAAYVVERMKDHGILLSTDGPDHNVIKMKPPLVFGEEEAARLLGALERVLSEDFVRA
jgi:4-aminobutyrate aminotransferase-like enzyme/Ser/Thr protein kinase RdoA (MazF antagonist)/murein DD-endopeptidase MepM/ murein hydrolase activator NlpD